MFFSKPYPGTWISRFLITKPNERGGILEPIINAFDPTARSLPNPPDKEDIAYLFKKLSRYTPPKAQKPGVENDSLLFDLTLTN